MLLDVGEYLFRIDSAPSVVKNNLQLMYGDAISDCNLTPADYTISLKHDSLLRKFLKPQVTFYLGSNSPFKPLPASQSYPVMEWGMNWCIAATDFNRLIVHAAVLVKNNKAIVFPATPGSGKSTLSAYFALSGWKLYSDEMAIIDLETLKVMPLFRPVCLKNESISLVKEWFPQSIFTGTAKDTQKGDVAHLKINNFAEYKTFSPVDVVAIVFPKFQKNTETTPYKISKIAGFEKLAANSFNYNVLGDAGFKAIQRLIESTQQVEVNYNDLSDVDDLLTSEFTL
jgi:HprK-related kinase A